MPALIATTSPREIGWPSSSAALVVGTPVWRQLHADDADDHAEQIGSWALRYEQLSAGRFQSAFFDVKLPGLQLFAESTCQAVRQRGGLGQGRLGMAFMRHGHGDGACNGQRFGVGALLPWHDAELDLRTPAACQVVGVVLSPELLPGRGEALPALSHPLHRTAPATQRLQRLVLGSLAVARRLSHRGIPSLSVAAVQWRDDLVDACLAAAQQVPEMGDRQRAQRRSQLVERACARMLAHVDQQQSVSQAALCRELGTSQRNLAYAFQEVLGLSPLAWLRVARLNAVRRELRSLARSGEAHGVCIYDVATRHGFWHFGRFSVEYRQQFGERPSESLHPCSRLRIANLRDTIA